MLDGCCNYFNPARPDPKFKGGRVRVFAHNDQRITKFPPGFYTTDAFTDHAITMIRQFAAKPQPFFVHVTYNAPHYPLHAPPEDIARYTGKYLEGWTALRERRHQRQVAMGLIDPAWQLPGPDPEVVDWATETNRVWQDRRMAVYAAMVDRMDQNIGRLLATLKETGVETNTLVMFLSDNGGCSEHYAQDRPEVTPGTEETYTTCGPSWAYAENTPFRRYKTWMHEGGISTPMIARWPGIIKPGGLTRQVGHIIDFLPTCLALAGGAYPQRFHDHAILPVEGLGLLPIFAGQERAGHPVLWWEYTGNRAIREGNWKLCWDKKVKHWELYDMVADRTETHDLAAQHPDRVQRMSASWLAWAKETGVQNRKNAVTKNH